jgi:glucose-6-phosphate dehydrogenase assembly protein OpcA
MWAPHGHDDAVRSVLDMIDVVLLDSNDLPDASDGLARADELLESVYVVDLAWLRTTPWRERIAASFDPPRRRAALQRIRALAVRHSESSAASGLLLAGWLASRLHWQPSALAAGNGSGVRGSARGGEAEIAIELATVELATPGLAGVTVTCENGFALSLDRASGGLCARARAPDGSETVWQVLGASRGEAGILGEGVRQALLRDPTYGPALDVAQAFCAG